MGWGAGMMEIAMDAKSRLSGRVGLRIRSRSEAFMEGVEEELKTLVCVN
jgi:hypothetical protein